MFQRRLLLASAAAALVAACGSKDSAAPAPAVTDAGAEAGTTDTDAGTYPASHPDLPQLVSAGGAVMKAPKLVPVFFPNDAMQAPLTDFVSRLGATDFWKANVAEYGVGAATSKAPIVLTEAAPLGIDDAAIATWLSGKVSSGVDGFAAPEEDTLFILYYPSDTSITAGGATSCDGFGGYHKSVAANLKNVAYAVIPRCASLSGLTGIDVVTAGTSHEAIEAALNPFPKAAPAYDSVDAQHIVWTAFGVESGDLCAPMTSSFYKPDGFDFTVQRSWSNQLAAAGHNPCAPQLPGEVYFNSAPVFPDNVTYSNSKGTTPTRGVHVAPFHSVTIDVELFSDGPTSGPWTLGARDVGSLLNGTLPVLSFSFDQKTGKNGDTRKLTINAIAAAPNGIAPFVVISTLGKQTSLWMGLVEN
jgi:hypothetical protein